MPFHPYPLLYLLLGMILGSLAPGGGSRLVLGFALGTSAIMSLLAIVRPRQVGAGALLCCAAAVGASLTLAARSDFRSHALPERVVLSLGPVVLQGRIATDPRVIDDEMRVDVDSAQVEAGGTAYAYHGRIRVFVHGNSTDPFRQLVGLRKGISIRAWVDLRAPEPVRSPGGFDQEAWAMRDGIHAFATCKSERLLEASGPPPSPPSVVDQLRRRLLEAWRHVPDPLNRAVTASMVLGDEGALDAVTRDDFRAAGLLHLLVVSGSQIATLLFGLRRVIPRTWRISWLGFAVEALVLVSYCTVAGADNSLLRATAMAIAFAIAVRIDVNRSGINCLAAAAILILVVRPLDLTHPGAQMSFAAALALMMYAGPLVESLTARRMPRLAAEVLASTLVASLAITPLTLIHFHRVSVISLPANLMAAPLAGILLYASLLTALLDRIFVPAAGIAGLVCGAIAQALRVIAHEAAKIDPDWRGPSPSWFIWAGILGLMLFSGWKRRAMPTMCLLAALSVSGPVRGDGRLHVWFLDVGQGDAILIQTPHGYAAAVDAGPAFEGYDAGERVAAEALWELGHRRLDFLAVTHRHADHEGGAPFLTRHFKPGRIFVNETSEVMRPWGPKRVTRGAEWTLDGVRFRAVAPDPTWPLPKRDENARSLVLEVRYGSNSLLLLGDAGSLTERLLDLAGRRFDVVKVAHHGAGTSSSGELIQAVQARDAIISVGARNRFSHPDPRAVRRWERQGARVWRTDIDRTIHLTSDGVNVRLEGGPSGRE